MKANRIAIILLSILLLASIALSLVLYARGRHYYRQLNEVQLDPLGLNHYPAGAEIAPIPSSPAKRVVFFGDSRARDWTLPSGMEQFEFINRSIGNQTTAQVLERFDEHVAPLQPDILILQVGINDLKTIPLFPERREATVADCETNIERIVSRAVDAGATVILTTIFPLGKVPLERRLFWSDEVGERLEEVNASLTALAGEQVIVLDSASILANEGGIVRDEYSRDLLHLDERGYQALNEELARILLTLEE
jgi:lysophospholipase L1-like esterase